MSGRSWDHRPGNRTFRNVRIATKDLDNRAPADPKGPTMSTTRGTGLARLAGIVAIIAGIIFIVAGGVTWAMVTSQLKAENLTGPADHAPLAGATGQAPYYASA